MISRSAHSVFFQILLAVMACFSPVAIAEQETPNMAGLRGHILAALGEEAAETPAIKKEAASKLVQPAVGFAIAASVALLAILGLRQVYVADEIIPDETPVAGITEPAVDDVLLEMRRRHARTASDFGSSDMLSTFVTFELREDELVQVDPEQPAEDSEEEEEHTETVPEPGQAQ